MNTIPQSHAMAEFTALYPPVDYPWGSLLATDGDEAKPPSNPRKWKWTCTFCLTSMLSNDITAHTTGRRHMAALAQAGDAQPVPTAATPEAEANPLTPPGMMSKNAAGHRNGKRHIAALVKAANARSGPTAASTAAEPNPLIPPHESKWTCTICRITMSLNDSKTHEKGKRHIKALAKIGNAQSGLTATPSLKLNFPNPEPSAPFAAFAIGGTKTSTSSKSLSKAQKKKAHTTANSSQGILPTPVLFYAGDWPREQERYESLYYSSPCDTYIDNLDYSMCDGDCGWCGECNDSAYPIHTFSTACSPSVPRVRSPLDDNNDPLAAFFALYYPFKYNSYNSSHVEYQRLCAFSKWPSEKKDKHHFEREKAWEGFRSAMVEAFNVTFGEDENDIEAWGRMCVLIGMADVPDTLEARREAVIQAHVNLCDLLDSARQRSRVRIFHSDFELRWYTIRTGSFFPRDNEYAGGLLKYLLREITGKYLGGDRVLEGSRKKEKEPPNRKGKDGRKS